MKLSDIHKVSTYFLKLSLIFCDIINMIVADTVKHVFTGHLSIYQNVSPPPPWHASLLDRFPKKGEITQAKKSIEISTNEWS